MDDDLDEPGTFDSSGQFVSTKQHESGQGDRNNSHSPPSNENGDDVKRSPRPQELSKERDVMKSKIKDTGRDSKDKNITVEEKVENTVEQKKTIKKEEKTNVKSDSTINKRPEEFKHSKLPKEKKETVDKKLTSDTKMTENISKKQTAPKNTNAAPPKKGKKEAEQEALDRLKEAAENMVLEAMDNDVESEVTNDFMIEIMEKR